MQTIGVENAQRCIGYELWKEYLNSIQFMNLCKKHKLLYVTILVTKLGLF